MAATFLSYLGIWSQFFKQIILLDKDEKKLFKYEKKFKTVVFAINKDSTNEFLILLKKNKIGYIVDLSNAETEVILKAVLKYGLASYINTSFGVAQSSPLGETLINFLKKREELNKQSKVPHILFSGMNPGVVNSWVQYGIKNFGKPKDVQEFEFDNTNYFLKKSSNVVTWCVEDFLDEAIFDSSEIMIGKRKVKHLYPNSLKNLFNVSDLFKPIYKIPKNVLGGIMAHEEAITLADKNNISFQYIYAYNQPTFKKLALYYDSNIRINYNDIKLIDPSRKLIGEDVIAVRLEYSDQYVYYFNSVKNKSLKNHTATSFQVVVGVYAALAVVLFQKKKKGIFFPEDLIENDYLDFVISNLDVFEIVISKKNSKILSKRKLEIEQEKPYFNIRHNYAGI